VVDRVPLVTHPNESNRKYLETKQAKMGHLLDLNRDQDQGRESGLRPVTVED
jgi:hypothetical protein